MNRIEDVYGLTPAQEGMFLQAFHDQHAATYQLCYLFQMEDGTDIPLFQQAIRLLALRHPVLKTAFAVVGGTIKQVILADRQPYIESIQMDEVFSEDVLQRIVREQSACPFDLQKDTLVRCFFICFSDKRFFLLHTHHLIADGWSMSILFQDLSAYYYFLIENKDPCALQMKAEEERAAQTSFAAYVNLIRAFDTDKMQRYWENRLAGGQGCTLPKTGGKRRTQIVRQGGHVSPRLRQRLEDFARVQHVPVNTVFECILSLTLQKHTGVRDLIFDKVISGKSVGLPQLERTVGPMINTVPVRACCADGITPLAFLQQIHSQSVHANEYGFLSLSDIFHQSGVDPNTVDVLFAFGNYDTPVSDTERPPMRFVSHKEETEFPLTVNLSSDGDGYCLLCTFDSARLSETLVAAIQSSFLFIAERFANADPTALADPSAMSAFLQLTPEEKQTILHDFNNTTVPYDKTKSVYTLFAAQAWRVPDRSAVIFQNQRISFFELLEQVDAAADQLHAFQVSSGDVVAICLDRTPLLIVYQLAVLKIGGVFLPIDKRNPKKRLQFICQDCNVRLLITDADVSALSADCVVTPEELRAKPVLTPHAAPCDAMPGYIIYTSGSTGAPKGCMLTQPGLVNFCINNNTLACLRQEETHVFACVNSVAFDYFIAESLLPLLNGYTVALCSEDESMQQSLFLRVVQEHQIDVLMTTPTRLALFYDPGKDCRALRQIGCLCTSGEPLNESLLNRIYAGSPAAQVYNPLGPSECTVWDLGGELDRSAGLDIHLGKPIANAQVYIVDSGMNPVPIGVTGELCIAGDGVGLGYLNRPALTTERFVDNPFGEGKLYETGDLVYWREDGNVVFVGRNDFQVKINGQRVELGEIEAALAALDGADSTAVIVRKDETGRQLLCAFYTGTETDGTALRASLSKTLPQYMVPQSFTHLETMPLTTSGKIDRHALDALPIAGQNANVGFAPPQNETERAICDVFAAALGQKEIGRDANFYDLGGTSLQLVRLLSHPLLDALTPSVFMSDPTPAGLAKRLDESAKTDYTYVVPLYTPKNAKKAIVLFPFAGGDAAAFTALAAKAREEKRDMALYFVDWPDEERLPEIEREIRCLTEKTDVWFYSHCAGCAIAMMLLDRLNEKTPCIRGYIAGANIPPRKALAGINAWARMSDSAIVKALENAGLVLEAEDDALLRGRLERFRRHTQICSAYFRGKTEKTKTTVTAIISKKDPFTPNYADAKARWRKVVTDVDRVVLLDTPSHYFQNTDTALLLDLFSNLSI